MYSSQYGSLANWSDDQKELKFVEATEPSITFQHPELNEMLFSIKASGIFYNRDAFPNHTSEQAAKLIAGSIRKNFCNKLDLKLVAYKEYGERVFKVSVDGIEHNYDVDTWHWWFLEYLAKHIKQGQA